MTDATRMLLPGATLGMLGGGQLGRMFTMAARTLGYRVLVLDPDPDSPAGSLADEHLRAPYDDPVALERMAHACQAITTEFENVPAAVLDRLADRCRVRPGAAAIAVTQDRIREKTFLRDHGFATARFFAVHDARELADAFATLGAPSVLKTSRFGYDGKGQQVGRTLEELLLAFRRFGEVPCVLEAYLDLACEISVVAARGEDGQTSAWPVAENRHANGILDVTLVPARVDETVARQAMADARAVAEHLAYIGVLAVEFFVLRDGGLLVNEIAPRPHNSGHYTLDATPCCQFEQQVRALCGLPLGDVRLLRPAVMVNLLGEIWADGEPAWDKVFATPAANLHLYGKREPRAGRKMGHLTVLGETREEALDRALALRAALYRAD